jgi:hypothetical protein
MAERRPGHPVRGIDRLEAARVPIAALDVRVAIRTVSMKFALITSNIVLVRIDLALLCSAALIPLLSRFEIAMLNGLVLPPLIVIALGAISSKLSLVLPDVALVVADVPIVVSNVAVVALDAMQLLKLCLRRSRAPKAGSRRESRQNGNRNGCTFHVIPLLVP